jgi:hypothetical protein
MPDIVGYVRMGVSESELLSDDISGTACCWWVWLGAGLNTADIERSWLEESGNRSDWCGG